MTYNARKVLADCALTLELLEEEKDLNKWRIYWVAGLALIRAVGHTLRNVDGINPTIFMVANAAFSHWKGKSPEHEIFRDFIEQERNNILKEYQFNFHPLEEVAVAVEYKLQAADGREMILGDVMHLDENLFRPIIEGYGSGEDARQLYAEAIEWWIKQLDSIDATVKSLQAL